MADGIDIQKMKDGRVLVILHPTCAITKEAIIALLAELGIDQAAVIFLLPDEVAEYCAGIDDASVVIPIDQASCNVLELDAAGQQCAQAGGRVIVLFGDGFPYEGLHPIADKYGTQCGWSVDQLGDCIKGPKLASPHDSGGTDVAWSKPSQVKCG